MREKLKELTKDTAIYGISTVVGRFLTFLLVPFYTHVINRADYGISSNIYAYLAFISFIYIYGMDTAYQKYAANADEKEKKTLFSTPFIFVVFTAVIFSLILFFARGAMNSLMEVTDKYNHLIYYMILIMFLDAIALTPFANLRLERKAKKFALIKIAYIFLQLILNIILIYYLRMGIEAIFISNLASSTLTLIMLIPEIKRHLVFKIDKETLHKMLRFGLPYLPASIGSIIVQVIDRPLVLAYTNRETLGVYQANYKLGTLMMLIVAMFQFAWQPFLLTNAKEKNAKEIFAKVLTLFLIGASAVWIIITLFVDNLVKLRMFGFTFFGKDYQQGWEIVSIILLAYMFHGMYVNFTAGIYIEDKNKFLPIITGAGALINVVVNILLIPVWGMMGAAIATLAAYMLMAGLIFILAQKYFHIEYEFRKVITILGLVLVTCSVYYILFYNGWLNIYNKILLLTVFSILMFAFKVIRKHEVVLTIKTLLRKA